MATTDLALPGESGGAPQPARPYGRSYALIRMSVGLKGMILPFALIVGEYFFVGRDVDVRGRSARTTTRQ